MALAAPPLPLTYVLAGWLGPPRHVASTILVSRDGCRLVTGSRRGNLWMWSIERTNDDDAQVPALKVGSVPSRAPPSWVCPRRRTGTWVCAARSRRSW
jgi:hypothetical protein